MVSLLLGFRVLSVAHVNLIESGASKCFLLPLDRATQSRRFTMEADNVLVKAAGIILYTLDASTKEPKYLLLKASNKPFHWTPPKGMCTYHGLCAVLKTCVSLHPCYRPFGPRRDFPGRSISRDLGRMWRSQRFN